MVSIVIPVYNSERYLRDCVQSVLNQTYKDIECILVDDASTDSSGHICDDIAKEDRRVKVLHHDNNKGLSQSRYDGYKLSTGDFIGFSDNDDYIAPWMYEEMMKSIGDADLCSFGGANVANDRFIQEADRISILQPYDTECRDSKGAVAVYSEQSSEYGLICCTWGKLYRRSFLDKVIGLMVEHQKDIPWLFVEDVVFTPMCYMIADKVVFCKSIAYLHRDMPESLSRMCVVKPYHYETARALDITLSYAKSHNRMDMYIGYIEPGLANLQSIWYKIDHFETDESKANRGKGEIKDFYSKYYSGYSALHKHGMLALSIMLFYRAYALWKITVDKFYFGKRYPSGR